MSHPKGNAGYRIARRTGVDRGWVTVYVTAEAELDTDSGPWSVVCEVHGAIVCADTRTGAEGIMRSGSTSFCDECRALIVKTETVTEDDAETHEHAARWRKIAHLLAALYKHGVPSERAVRLGKRQLQLVAKVAGVNAPSDTTIKLLRETLRKIPQPKTD